ncbi:MAG: DUF4082 domain-containing protein, partial [Pseudobdellovibrionaceae bacterium]
PTPQSVFTTQLPTDLNNTDGPTSDYELGMGFTSSVNGQIKAIRFYKGSLEAGSHIGRIWSSTGQLLASVTFTSETASGWQQQLLLSPLSIQANTEYIVTVNTTNTYYVSTQFGLVTSIIHGNLSSVVGNNGVFGPVGQFPTQTWNSMNYFRDIVFVSGP